MKFRTLTLLAALALIGCGDDGGATAIEVDDGSTTPTDTSVSETTPPADGTADDTTTPSDTSTPPADTMMAGDAPAPTTSMKCGLVTCNTATQDCCVTAGVGVCTTKGGTCAGARYSCTSKSNCAAGQVCCVSGAGTGGASCTASGSCPSSTTCESNADCSGKLKNCRDIGSGIKVCST